MKTISKDNPYGKTGDITTRQIIDRILGQHFDSSPNRQKTIGEIQDEMLREMSVKVKVLKNGFRVMFVTTSINMESLDKTAFLIIIQR